MGGLEQERREGNQKKCLSAGFLLLASLRVTWNHTSRRGREIKVLDLNATLKI